MIMRLAADVSQDGAPGRQDKNKKFNNLKMNKVMVKNSVIASTKKISMEELETINRKYC